MTDTALWDVIREIPQQTQRQYGTDEQLRYLMAAANKLGLYDAADFCRRGLSDEGGDPSFHEEQAWQNQVKRHDAGEAVCSFPCEVCASRDQNYLRKHDAARKQDPRDVRAARDFRRD